MADNPIAKQRVVLELPDMDKVAVRLNVPYGRVSMHRRMDVYRPPGTSTALPLPAVVFVTGYPDAGAEKMLGSKLKEMASYICWARLVASIGLVAILYENEEPAADARTLLDHLRVHSESLGLDAKRLGVWSCSGNVPNALGLLAENPDLACAALCYGLTVDLDGHSEVAESAAQYGFANAPNLSVSALPPTPMLLVRAGRDEVPGLNAALDRFVTHALRANLPLTLINYPDGPHAFDIVDRSAGSVATIRHVLAFLRTHLVGD
jgi:dienelactone hydrolase